MIARALFLRPARRRPWRYLLTVAGVAAGVAAVISTVAANRAAVRSMSEDVEEIAGRTQIEVYAPGGLDATTLGSLRPLAGDAILAPVIEEIAAAPALDESLRVLGADLLVYAQFRDVRLPDGAAPSPELIEALLRGDGCLASASLMRRRALEIGGGIELLVRSKPMRLRIIGAMGTDGWGGAWDNVLLMDVGAAQALFGRGGRLDRIEMLPRAGASIESIQLRAREMLGADYQVAAPRERAGQARRMVRALEFNLTALSGISLLVGGMLVAVTLATSVVQRRGIIALLRSLGASRAQIAGTILAEAATIGLAGGAAGVAVGLWGARAALAASRTAYAVSLSAAPGSSIHISPMLALIGVGLGLAVSLIAATLPLVEATQTPPLQNLRSERPAPLSRRRRRAGMIGFLAMLALAWALTQAPPIDGLPVAALAGGLALMGSFLFIAGPALDWLARHGGHAIQRLAGAPGRLALAGLSAGRRRASWAAGAIGVSVGLAVAIATMVYSFRQTVIDWTNEGLRADLWVRPAAAGSAAGDAQAGRLDPEVARIARSVFGDGAVDPYHQTRALIESEAITLAGGSMDVLLRNGGGPPFMDGRSGSDVYADVLNHGGVTVNESLARRFGVGVGDAIHIRAGGKSIERRVAGVFYHYGNNEGLAVLNLEDYLNLLPDEGPSGVSIFLPDDTDVEAARNRMQAALGGRFEAQTLLNNELREQALRIFDRTFAITRALELTATMVAIIAVAVTLLALVNERRGDLATLRALGGGRGQVAGVVICQAGALGALGLTGGLAIGLCLGWTLVKIVNAQSFGWTLRFLPPWSEFGWITAWVIAGCLAAGVAPAWIAAGRRLCEELQEE